jgi:geranylgeranyl diphosphate synthase type I
MSEHRNLVDNELTAVIEERTKRVLEKYGQTVDSKVKDSRLLAILQDVKNYWRDSSRANLTSFSCEAVGGDPEMAENAALIFTLASSGFGIHDDILDRSPNKHLRMTVLGLHGADSALLVGDLLIVKGWSLTHEMIRKTCNPTRIADVIEAYGDLCVEICEAEFLETQCRRKVDTNSEYYLNILWKSMAETEACSRIGAILGDGKPKEIEALAEFGRRLGFISRLANDVEDCLNTKGDLVHRIEHESVPLPLLYAAESSPKNYLRIKNIVEKSDITPSDAKALLKLCFETGAFGYVRNIAKKNEEKASRLLHLLEASNARNVLSLMIRKSYARTTDLCI